MRVYDIEMSEQDGSVESYQHGVKIRVVEWHQNVVYQPLLL